MTCRSELKVERDNLGNYRVVDDGFVLARGSSLDYVIGRVDSYAEVWPEPDREEWKLIANESKRAEHLGLAF